MSTLQIEERITVHAPPKRVWKFLLDPARVAACLPGAKLDGTEGEDTFLGTMKIKVGPVVMEIKGKATMSHIDPVERRVTLSGTGNDKAGGGSARMDMKSQILEVEGGGSEILVHADVHLAGKLVRFGRGMMEGISKQLFKQFAERVHAALDEDDEDDEEHGEEAAVAPAEPAPTVEAKAPTSEAKAPTSEAATPEAATPEAATPEAATPAAVEDAPAAEPKSVEKAPLAEPERDPAPVKKAPLVAADNAPLDAGGLVWAAIWAWIKGLFARISGRKG